MWWSGCMQPRRWWTIGTAHVELYTYLYHINVYIKKSFWPQVLKTASTMMMVTSRLCHVYLCLQTSLFPGSWQVLYICQFFCSYYDIFINTIKYMSKHNGSDSLILKISVSWTSNFDFTIKFLLNHTITGIVFVCQNVIIENKKLYILKFLNLSQKLWFQHICIIDTYFQDNLVAHKTRCYFYFPISCSNNWKCF